ncbi:MAG: HAD-IIA family hydrolase [Chloroflexi bacterium]|jgi:4-nitrophenyl phosphatase|nr:HAD-IIA family hydrolase [Chloroflexota bacterium]
MSSQIPPAIRNLIIDMDGVLWRGEKALPGLVQFFEALQAKQINYVMATNNGTKTAVMYKEKLARFGVLMDPMRILTVAEATASYLQDRYSAGTPIYVLGSKGLRDAHLAVGFQIVSPEQVRNGETAAVVVGGLHFDFTYESLAMGALLVERGAQFVATDLDSTHPSESGSLPGGGAILSVIITTTGVTPVSIGKPGPILFRTALERLGGNVGNTAMIGDRLGTDIAGGNAAGLYTILVLTGVSTVADAESGNIKPDAILKDITEVARCLA